MFPSPPRKYHSVLFLSVFWRSTVSSVDSSSRGFFSAAASTTSMDIDKGRDDEETADAATSRAGAGYRSCLVFSSVRGDGRLNFAIVCLEVRATS